MSRTKKGSKSPGWDYWGKRPIGMGDHGTKGKRTGIQRERVILKRELKNLMKKKIEFDCYDHFKGNFKRPEKKSATTGDIIRNMQEAYNQMVHDALVYGKGYALVPKEYNQIQMSQGEAIKRMKDIVSPEFEKRVYGHFTLECIHDPIDVGFSQSKMVCKKCDKDL